MDFQGRAIWGRILPSLCRSICVFLSRFLLLKLAMDTEVVPSCNKSLYIVLKQVRQVVLNLQPVGPCHLAMDTSQEYGNLAMGEQWQH